MQNSYLPLAFVESLIICLIYNIHGELTKVSNYTAIMISNAISRILENLIIIYCKDMIADNETEFAYV
jgi:hypothetical protein